MPLPLHQPETSRRKWLQKAAVACALVSPWVRAQGKDKHLPGTTSLPLSLQQALQAKQPLVVMVSLEGCPFCKMVRENYLLPLQREGLPVVQINMRDKSALMGFDGTAQTQDALIRQWGIKLAPTVLFFGERGQEVAQRLNGAYLPDFYNAYLEEQLTIARRAVVR